MTQDDRREPTTGIVTEWHDADGLGVITSEDVPGEVWVHFSHIVMKPPRNLTVGRSVRFTWEEFPQDGYRFELCGSGRTNTEINSLETRPTRLRRPSSGATSRMWKFNTTT